MTPLTESEQLKNYTFAEKQPVSSLIERMVAIDATWDRIKLCQKAGWKSPADHPDVTPAHEALQLVEHFRELARIEAPSKVFARRLITATNLAEELEQNLRSNAGTIIIDSFFKNIGNSCSECHAKTRDQKPR